VDEQYERGGGDETHFDQEFFPVKGGPGGGVGVVVE
jgi:hypothetical protein